MQSAPLYFRPCPYISLNNIYTHNIPPLVTPFLCVMQQGKKTMRNVSKNRFLTCFRPDVVDIDAMLESRTVVDHSSSRRLACITVEDKHDTKNSTTKATISEKVLEQNWIVPHRPKRTFSKVAKTVLNSRVRNNKSSKNQNCFGSKRYLAYTESSSTDDEKQAFVVVTNFKEIKAPEWCSSISSSNSPVSESKNNVSKNEFTKDQVKKQKKFPCVGMYLFLISLVVTVFWGNINVIILTSMLLCFFSSCYEQKEVPMLRKAQSKSYKNISPRDHSGRSGRNKERL